MGAGGVAALSPGMVSIANRSRGGAGKKNPGREARGANSWQSCESVDQKASFTPAVKAVLLLLM